LITKDRTLTNPFQFYSTHVSKSVLDFAIEDGDTELIKIILKESEKINNGHSKRPTLPTSSLSNVGTGTFNKYQFGFNTRPVNLGRGGKEGNNAFTHDSSLTHMNTNSCSNFDHLLNHDVSWKVFEMLILTSHNTEAAIWNLLWIPIRRGNVEFLKSKSKKDGPTLIQKLFDNYGYGFNRYHHIALEDDIEGRINKLSMLKKPHTNKGICPLHVACINPNVTVLRKYYATNPDYSAADMEQRKLIHYAAANQSDVALKFLVSKGIPVNDKDSKGVTPLMIACELGRTENVEYILKEQKKILDDLDKDDEDYQMMLKSTDFINSYGPSHHFPIHYAALSGNFETVKAVVEGAGDNIDLEVRTTDGKSPLSIACCNGNYDIAEYLLSKGVQVHENKKQKKNPLIWAAQNGHINIVSLLLRHGIHPDLPDSSNNTATHYAAGYGWLNILTFLIENGAHPDLRNDWNSTPAMIAMLKNHFGCLDYLMDIEGVDKSMVDNEGRTIISQLCMNFTQDTLSQIKYMDKYKHIDYNCVDASGSTCMHYLVSNEKQTYNHHQEVVKRLNQKKEEVEKRLGRKIGDTTNDDNANMFGGMSKRPTKKMAMKKRARGPAPVKMAAPAFNLSAFKLGDEEDMNVDEVDDETNPQTYVGYFQNDNLVHRKMLREVREDYEDSIIECAKHLYNKGVKHDSICYNGLSTVRLAIDAKNTKVAIWLINNLCDGEIPEEVFQKIENQQPNQQVQSFLFSLATISDEINWDPIIDLMIKRCKKEQLHDLLSQTLNGENPVIYLLKNGGQNFTQSAGKIRKHEEKLFLDSVDMIVKLTKACDFDISSTICYDKNITYNYQTKTYADQEELNKHFEELNEEKLDSRVNGFGMIDMAINESDLVYFDDDPKINSYSCQNVNSNILHAMIRQYSNEDAIIG